MKYDARQHFQWLLGSVEFRGALRTLRDKAEAERRVSRAWREYGLRELDAHGSVWAPRYRTHVERVSKVLPPRMRPLLPALVLNQAAPLEIAVGYGMTDRARVTKLQDRCTRHLARELLTSNDRKRMRDALELIDPPSVVLNAVVARHLYGRDVGVSATAAEVGTWVAHASAAGEPVLGVATKRGIEPFAVEPFSVFADPNELL